MTYNKLGDLVETKYIIQKSFFRFWWKDIEFVELSTTNPHILSAASYGCMKYFSTYEKAEQALLKYNEIEGRTYQTYEGHRIYIAVNWFGDLVYCYKTKYKYRDEYNLIINKYYYFETIDALQTHIKSQTVEHRELISSEFNLK